MLSWLVEESSVHCENGS